LSIAVSVFGITGIKNMTESFDYHCNLCANDETLDHEDTNWLCLCHKKPQGLNYLQVCAECNNHRWASKSNTECPNCFANKLTKKEHSVSVEHFGDMKNMPVRKSEEERMKAFDNSYQIFEEAKRKALQNKIDTQKAILIVPELLKDVNEKLDRILSKQRDTKTDEIQTDELGYVIFNKGGQFDV
jgi:hypothetical protein